MYDEDEENLLYEAVEELANEVEQERKFEPIIEVDTLYLNSFESKMKNILNNDWLIRNPKLHIQLPHYAPDTIILSTNEAQINHFIHTANIAPNVHLYINGVVFHKSVNSNRARAVFAYPDGYVTCNRSGTHPLESGSFQLSMCQNFTGDNSIYNGMVQIQIKLHNDTKGKSIKQIITVSGAYEKNTYNTTLTAIHLTILFYEYLATQYKAEDYIYGEKYNNYNLPELSKEKMEKIKFNLESVKKTLCKIIL